MVGCLCEVMLQEEKRVNKRFKGFERNTARVSISRCLKLAKSKTMCKVLTMTDVADLVACAQAGKVVQEDSEDQNWSRRLVGSKWWICCVCRF